MLLKAALSGGKKVTCIRTVFIVVLVCFATMLFQQEVSGASNADTIGASKASKQSCQKQRSKKKKHKNKKNRLNDCTPAATNHHESHVVYGSVIGWADRPFGNSIVSWANRSNHSDVIAWSNNPCQSHYVVNTTRSNRWLPTTSYWESPNVVVINDEIMDTSIRTIQVKRPRRVPSRPRSNAPHSGVVHWSNDSRPSGGAPTLADARPRVLCLKHASRVCGCYGPTNQDRDQLKLARRTEEK